MAELSESQREHLQDRDFAFVDDHGGRHLPIHDEAHVRNAVARFAQTHFGGAGARREAARRIVHAAEEFGVALSPGDAVSEAAAAIE